MAEYENGMSQRDNRTDAFKKFALSLKKKKVLHYLQGQLLQHPYFTFVLLIVVEMITN